MVELLIILILVIHTYKHFSHHSLLKKINMNIDDLIAEVAAQKTQIETNNALLAQLNALAKAAGTDPVKLQELSDAILANTKALADADTSNAPTV